MGAMIIKLLQLRFLPASVDLALLVLRVWLGLSMLVLHGWDKLSKFESMAGSFPDPFGIGSKASLGLAVFAELVCSALLVVGLFTRFAALNLAVTMGVAFFIAHEGQLRGAGSGETAFIYLAGYVTLLLAGAGRFSADTRIGVARALKA